MNWTNVQELSYEAEKSLTCVIGLSMQKRHGVRAFKPYRRTEGTKMTPRKRILGVPDGRSIVLDNHPNARKRVSRRSANVRIRWVIDLFIK